MRIAVTAEDIAEGVREDGQKCMVARAVTRETGLDHIEVGSLGISRNPSDEEFYFSRFPEYVTEAIESFDRGEPVEPFEFDLDVAGLAPVVGA